MNHETRIGATLDIMCDRLSAATFYVGFAWYDPTMIAPVGIYLAEFMVIDMFLSLAFLAWPISSPNYFYLIDRRLYMWNWSRIGKAANSGLFAIFMVWTREPVIAGVIAAGLFTLKAVSMGWMMKLGVPVPTGCLKPDPEPDARPCSLMGLLLATFGVAVASALFPLINIEAYIAGVGALVDTYGIWPVAIVAGAGQAVGKILWYEVGRSSMNWSYIRKKMESPSWQKSVRQGEDPHRRPALGRCRAAVRLGAARVSAAGDHGRVRRSAEVQPDHVLCNGVRRPHACGLPPSSAGSNGSSHSFH